jgi:hypothetical protein
LASQIFCVGHINEELRDERNFRMNDVVTSLLPRGLLFVIDNRRTGAMLVAMSADILYSTEARHALRFVFTLTLGIWR